MKLNCYKTLIVFLVGVLPKPLVSQVTVSTMFADGMVLQQNSNVNIWGWASPGESVTVTGSWNNKAVTTTTSANKKWMLKLNTPDAKADDCAYTITIKGTNFIELKDVLIGEVWLLSGQSNMEHWLEGWPDAPVEGSAQAIASADYPKIRLFVAGWKSAASPQPDITRNWINGTWTACSPASASYFSAVGYFFGRELFNSLKIPVGLVQSTWGGSSCEAWANAQSLNSVSDFKNKGPWIPVSEKDNQTATVLYNGMIAPIVPFTIAGVLWYQGETNVGRPIQFSELFPAMIKGWRYDFQNNELPFYFVQLCPWGGYGGTFLPEFWEAQACAQSLKNTGMVGTLDIGDVINIHPAKKEQVGYRLALWALSKNYGYNNLICSGPQYKSMKIEANKIRISFNYVGIGLKAQNNSPTEFEIAGSNQYFYQANTLIEGQTLLVWSEQVTDPKYVRYAWSGIATASLFNQEGFPATPFRKNTPSYITTGIPFGVKQTDGVSQISIFPNPTKGQLYISGTKPLNHYLILIVCGQVLMQGNLNGSKIIDVQNLKSGNYLIHIDGTNGVQTEKFIKL